MKKIIILILSIGISFSTLAQKKELKKAEKLVKSFKTGAAFNALNEQKDAVVGTEYESYYYFLRGKNFFGKSNKNNFDKAVKEFYHVLAIEVKSGQDDYSDKAISYINIINDSYFSEITKALAKTNYIEAGKVYEKYYKTVPERRDVLRMVLYCYQNAKDNDKIAEVLHQLLMLDTGDMSYNATNKHTKRVDEFFKKESRDLAVKRKTHEKPDDLKIETKTRVDYYNSLVRIYHQKGDSEKTLEVLSNAKKEFPAKVKFFEDYAAVVYGTGDKEAYLKSLEEVFALDASNRDLWFNYGVISQDLGKKEKAIEAYDKAIEIDPEYRGAYINKALLILADERDLINELNENLRNKKKYNEIDTKIKEMYSRAIPAFEKANELKPDEGIKATLENLYKSLEKK